MKSSFVLVVLMLGCAAIASAQPGWTTPDGRAVPETESRRAVGGFCGQLIVTAGDWQAKWETATTTVPIFEERKSVARGEHLAILTVYANPMLRNGRADLTCDLEIERPDGSTVHQEALPVRRGPAPDPKLVHLSPAVVDFVGEPEDPSGLWTVKIRLHDHVRGVTVPLEASFTLEP